MLRAKALPEVLSQIVGGGVDASMLLTLDGALMGSVSSSDASDTSDVDHKVLGAISAHTWSEYLLAGREAMPANEIQSLLVELERGRVAMAPAGANFLVCAYSHGSAPAGVLKAKVEMLSSSLASSLDQIQVE